MMNDPDVRGGAMEPMAYHLSTGTGQLSRDIDRLPAARRTQAVDLGDGDKFDLRIGPVANRIGDAVVRMLAYNGSISVPPCACARGSKRRLSGCAECDFDRLARLRASVAWPPRTVFMDSLKLAREGEGI
jgi:hypothetical protein